jgi:uncharacterized protein (DUF362 family)/Pyruvate/2-oxoacid:ferredoxin oxidoreductase delta subunit
MKTPVSIVKCASYEPVLVEEAVKEAVGLLGGIGRFIKPDSKVLVKPNILMGIEPEAGIDTHPEVVRSVIRCLKEIGCEIIVGDGPSVWGKQISNIDEVYRRSGISKICQEETVELVKFDKRRWRGKFPMTVWLDSCDHFVSIPKFKTHDLTLLTGAVKNLFGLVSGTFKTELHKNHYKVEDFSRILVDIYQEAKPDLTVIDGIVAMEGDGPASGGKLRNLGVVLAGADCVALDSVMALIMGIKPLDVLSTREAARRKLGNADISSIEILGAKIEEANNRPFVLPSTSFKKNIPLPLVNIARKLIKYYPYVQDNNCVRCSACVQACPTGAVLLKNNKISFNYAKCISCFCCQEACPASAIRVRKSILARMIGL